MNMNSERAQEPEGEALESIISEYVASAGAPGYGPLNEWIERYPQYARELTDFTAGWSVVEHVAVSDAELASQDVEDAVVRHMGIVRQVVARQRGGQAEQAATAQTEGVALRGLIAEGQASGVTMRRLAEQAGLSVSLLTSLDRRLVRYASIPGEVISTIAAALGRDVKAVSLYLQGGPRFAPGASYRADKAPRVPDQQDFAQVVREDRTLSAEQKKRLLAMPFYAQGQDTQGES